MAGLQPGSKLLINTRFTATSKKNPMQFPKNGPKIGIKLNKAGIGVKIRKSPRAWQIFMIIILLTIISQPQIRVIIT